MKLRQNGARFEISGLTIETCGRLCALLGYVKTQSDGDIREIWDMLSENDYIDWESRRFSEVINNSVTDRSAMDLTAALTALQEAE